MGEKRSEAQEDNDPGQIQESLARQSRAVTHPHKRWSFKDTVIDDGGWFSSTQPSGVVLVRAALLEVSFYTQANSCVDR